ncbi:MAG TPA: hypothetical protein PKA79_01455 [Oligoflexia bacterium]|nr:hypothetical protein [Oligoflexia bacterium]
MPLIVEKNYKDFILKTTTIKKNNFYLIALSILSILLSVIISQPFFEVDFDLALALYKSVHQSVGGDVVKSSLVGAIYQSENFTIFIAIFWLSLAATSALLCFLIPSNRRELLQLSITTALIISSSFLFFPTIALPFFVFTIFCVFNNKKFSLICLFTWLLSLLSDLWLITPFIYLLGWRKSSTTLRLLLAQSLFLCLLGACNPWLLNDPISLLSHNYLAWYEQLLNAKSVSEHLSIARSSLGFGSPMPLFLALQAVCCAVYFERLPINIKILNLSLFLLAIRLSAFIPIFGIVAYFSNSFFQQPPSLVVNNLHLQRVVALTLALISIFSGVKPELGYSLTDLQNLCRRYYTNRAYLERPPLFKPVEMVWCGATNYEATASFDYALLLNIYFRDQFSSFLKKIMVLDGDSISELNQKGIYSFISHRKWPLSNYLSLISDRSDWILFDQENSLIIFSKRPFLNE